MCFYLNDRDYMRYVQDKSNYNSFVKLELKKLLSDSDRDGEDSS